MRGYHFTPLSIPEIVAHMYRCWEDRVPTTVQYQNLHTLHLQTTDPQLRDCYKDTVTLVDGLPIIAALRVAGHKFGRSDRVTGLDLVDPVLDCAQASNKAVYIIGQPGDVLSLALEELRSRYPALEIDGHHGFFERSGPESENVIKAANDFGADLVIVGLGTPASEKWIRYSREEFDAPVVWVAGALMEYIAGSVPTPPRWSGPLGLEWAFRLASDPKRFFSRYVIEPPMLLWRLVRQRRE